MHRPVVHPLSVPDPPPPVTGIETGDLVRSQASVPGDCTDWSRFGALFPVLAGSSGAGSSVLAAGLADVLAEAGLDTLLVDPAEPALSGLAVAAASDIATQASAEGVRWSPRGPSVLARLDDDFCSAADAFEVKGPLRPDAWLPTEIPPATTVVDLGSTWRTRADSAFGRAWLRTIPGTAAARPYPLLVVRPTRPSLLAAEAALARFAPWLGRGEMAGPAQLVVTASWRARWPAGVAGAAGARLAPLLDDALFVPFDEDLERGGVTDVPTPARVRTVLAEFLERWAPSPLASPTRPSRRR